MTSVHEHHDRAADPMFDLDAERAVLDALMSNPDIAATTGLKAGHFYKPQHAVIFDAITALADAGEPTDPITVAARIAAEGNDVAAGGRNYVLGVYSSLGVLGHTGHAKDVIEYAQKRQVGQLGVRLNQLSTRPGAPAADILEQAQAFITGLADTIVTTGPVPWSAVLEETMTELDEEAQESATEKAVPAGIIDLDRLLNGGFHPNQLVVVAARPGVGKSIFAADVLRAASLKRDVPALFCSLEMGRGELARRIIAAQYRILKDRLDNAQLTEEDWFVLARGAGEHTEAPLYIDDTAGQTFATIRANARRMAASKTGLGVVVVDYLQLVMSQRGRRSENRQQEVSELSRNFKLLAKELEVPVVLLAQLNRGPEQRADKMPQLADLRESGAIEQDADVVILLHRPDYYDRDDRPGEIDLVVAKHRNGPTGVVTAAFQGHYSRIADMHPGA